MLLMDAVFCENANVEMRFRSEVYRNAVYIH